MPEETNTPPVDEMAEETTPVSDHELPGETNSSSGPEISEEMAPDSDHELAKGATSSPDSEMPDEITLAPGSKIPEKKANPQLIGCLLDVSGSMKAALETGKGDERAVDRLRAVIRATIKVAQTENSNDPDSQIFVGAFGLKQQDMPSQGSVSAFRPNMVGNDGCPPAIDLCGAIDALLGDHEDRRSGRELLVDLANSQDLGYITEYIETRLTDDQARFVFAHLRLHGQGKVQEFVDAIPPPGTVEETVGTTRVAGNIADALIDSSNLLGPWVPASLRALRWAFWGSTADRAEAVVVDNSKAFRMAQHIARTWLNDFREFQPRKVSDVIRLLQRLEERTASEKGNGSGEGIGKGVDVAEGEEDRTLLDTLREYLYGLTPMHHALETSLSTFREHREVGDKTLIMVSDGVYTDEDPLPVAQELKDEGVTLATVFLTEDSSVPREVLHDRHGERWHRGQRILFDMASRVRGSAHPVPVLANSGWSVPSSGDCALYATVCSPLALEEFCAHLLSARLRSADVLLDLLGQTKLDKVINDIHVRVCTNPSYQGDRETCYAHAVAAVTHMALLRIAGWRREGGRVPRIRHLRQRILASFPEDDDAWAWEELLRRVEGWYPPLKIRPVGKDEARQAVLRRRPVLATFYLSGPGWDTFRGFFKDKATMGSTLAAGVMRPHRELPPDGGHAVVLADCAPRSLTFLNSWGRDWGDGGRFSVEDAPGPQGSKPDAIPFRFYDVFWYEADLTDAERAAYKTRADGEARQLYNRYPGMKEQEAMCPHCKAASTLDELDELASTISEAVCPRCKGRFELELDHLLQGLYARDGLEEEG